MDNETTTTPPPARDQGAPKEPDILDVFAEAVGAEGDAAAHNVQVWRRSGRGAKTGKFAYGTSIALDEFSIDAVADRWGGGDYAAKLQAATSGRIIRSMQFTIDGPPRPFRDDDDDDQDDDAGARAYTRELERRLAALEQAPKRGGGEGEGVVALAVQMATAMSAAQAPLLKLFAEMGGSRGDAMSPADLLAFMREAREMAQEDRGPDPLFAQIGGPILAALQGFQNQGAATPTHAIPARTGREPEAVNQPHHPTPAWVQLLAPHMAQLQQLAAAHGDVNHWAPMVVDTASEALVLTMEEEGRRPTFLSEFLAWFPDAVPYRSWYSQFFRAIVEEIDDRREAEGDDDDDDQEQGVELGIAGG